MAQLDVSAPIGRRLPLYQALLECGHRNGPRLAPGTSAAIWHAIDVLHAGGGAAAELRILEGIAVEVHVLKQCLADPAAEPDADLPPRRRIADLTRQWLEVAPLRA